ncbi:calexcitin-2-like [Schistocerca gregaria]|uniref:calexcitin-2-like n=1 Tax=Schistocerca gregaria TaxID=7010 RepID=UPI00211E9421|nr:calexcitin-2-like [Schistocerca gregaria]XP_049843020.1 calexcitin-2-like [Schistocerca gregaria]
MADFRKKKLMYVFSVFFDVNRSGTIEKKDFEIAIEKICRTRGWAEGSADQQKTRNTLLQVWEGLQQRADANKDGQVSETEWVQMWEDFAKSGDSVLEWQSRYRDFMFQHVDSSGDGTIDLDEFISVYTSYGISEEECRKAYSKFTNNQSVQVTPQVFEKLWREFFSSTDPEAPGNFIFGKTSFD